MNSNEALDFILNDIRFYEPTCIEDRVKRKEAIMVIKKGIEILEKIKQTHVKLDSELESLSVWPKNAHDYYEIVRWLNG